jgi:hypothetical protein
MSTRRNTSARELRAVKNEASRTKGVVKKLEEHVSKRKLSKYMINKRQTERDSSN